jgi:uncharacterized SAM-binding protein YcdF (DUF218 family)
MLFVLKKAVSRLLFPLPLSILLLLAGLALGWRNRHPRWTRTLLIAGLALLVLFSTSAFSDLLLRPLESRYPALGPEELSAIDWETVNTIVVFTGCAVGFEDEPITRQVGGAPLARLVEGVRLYHECPGCRLILSGGLGCDPDAPAEAMTNYRWATTFGVAPQDITLERTSLDTADQARILATLLVGDRGQEPFIVVTSASHMPRTMALLEAEGLIRAIPAPTDHATGLYSLFSREAFGAESLYPNAQALWNSERAVYEYLGLFWIWLGGLF